MSDNKTKKRWTVEVTKDGDILYRNHVLWIGYSNIYNVSAKAEDIPAGVEPLFWGPLDECLAFIDEQEDGKRC